MPRQGAGENNRAQRNRESVFPPVRPHSAGSGECGALAASAVGGGIRRPCAGVIFSAISYYRKTSGRGASRNRDTFPRRRRPPGGVRSRRGARIPRMPGQGRRASSPARGDRESVFPPVRPHSAGSGECACATPARPVSPLLRASVVCGRPFPRGAPVAPPQFSPRHPRSDCRRALS